MREYDSEQELKGLLHDRVKYYISLKQEGETWDFKRQWYTNEHKEDLLIDIISMANLVSREDGLIIIGVDEENDYSVCGVENDPFRKRTQDLVCFLQSKKFAGGSRPIAYVETITIDGHQIDVIIIANSNNTPFYLAEKYNGVPPFHIYTRVMDTNTPKNSSADIDRVEALWRKRFGIDLPAIQKAYIYLQKPSDWKSIDGEQSHFYRYSPEYCLRCEHDDTRTGYEYYHFSQVDSNPSWYEINLYCHQTVIYQTLGISLDGGRYFTVVPDLNYFYSNIVGSDIWLSYYVKGSFQYALHKFYSEYSANSDSRMAMQAYLECVIIFQSEKERKDFWIYAAENFKRDCPLVRHRHMPLFSESLSKTIEIDHYKTRYRDALLVHDLLDEYRDKQVRTITAY